MRTKDGKSRQFAFIGYRTENEAHEAIRYFNNSFLRTSKISCEVARKLGDENLPRPWSRHSKKKDDKGTVLDVGKPARAKGRKENLKNGVDVDDPQLQDFLQVMQPRVNSKMWANDTSGLTSVENNRGLSNKDNEGASVSTDDSGSLEDGFLDISEPSGKSLEPERDEVISDMDYFKSKVTKEWSDSESSDEDDDDNDDNDASSDDNDDKDDNSDVNEDGKISHPRNDAREVDVEGKEDTSREKVTHEKSQVNVTEHGGQLSKTEDVKGVFESCRLFVRNLPYTTTEEELEEHFNHIGSISQVHLVVDKDTKRSKGIAYILYTAPEFADRALKELDNSIFQGRLLHVMPALQRHSENQENNVLKDQSSKTLKKQREEKRKANEASGDTRAWNSLFMRPDTIVENIARKYGVDKSDLLDGEADDLAVRIALGETQVISETKNAFKNAGVNVEALEKLANNKIDGLKRSNHVLLVKNLPYGSTENELAKMFGKFGSLDKIILPPTKTLALVYFLILSAKRRWKNEDGSNGCSEGLNRERRSRRWLWRSRGDFPVARGRRVSCTCLFAANIEAARGGAWGRIRRRHRWGWPSREEANQIQWSPDGTVTVAGDKAAADWSERSAAWRRVTERWLSKPAWLAVARKDGPDPQVTRRICDGGRRRQRRRRWLELAVTAAESFLDSHALILQPCHVKNDAQKQKTIEKDKSSTKLLVRNVAFEATEKDLRRLFSPFGQIKSLRLPMKFGSHRGFAFVKYVNQQEAQNALKALSSTHLYGRHLVIERAKEGESLEELRARTASQFSDDHKGFQGAIKLSKKRKDVDILDEGKTKFGRFDD
ncbi:hypothetical protein LR48_Vigan07g221300 [Vigna angularis]|uniref:RRM domain-containing protein n=1 Tax=Phaseolus angularis TaxID=3914 RepID=A0A0L9V195_PHAAN|nr:hypothetical protein LR48_Vigan07g221300 [Vigna angularis]